MRWSAPYTLTDMVRVGDRVLPRTFEVRSHNDEPGPDVRARFELVDGAYQCREVNLSAVDGGREVNSTDLRAVRVDDLLGIGVDLVGAVVVDERDGVVRVEPHTTDHEREGAVRLVDRARGARKRTIDDDLLREVADVYQANVADAPTRAVADHFDKSLRTASLYVQRARAEGFLGGALPGKASER